MPNMAIISSFKSIICYPKETVEISRMMTVRRESRFTTQNTVTICASNSQSISIKKGENINILPKLQQSCSVNDEPRVTVQVNEQLQKRVQNIREMMAQKAVKCYQAEDLVMIDAIQRLGLQYYFQNEISGALTRHYEICGSGEGDYDLHDTALRFRLLRQHGYNVSADCFSKFKDKDGNFKQELRKDSKGLKVTEELKLARNQTAKWHMWSLTCLPIPDMAEQRVELTKAIAFVYIVDDIFDVYGTLDELILFTEAVNSWEYDDIIGLPNYMTVCLNNLYELINEISEKAYDSHGWNPKEFLQKVWKDLFNAFLVEAKWFASGHTPLTDEYLKNGRVSCGVGIVCAHLFLLLGEGGNKKGQGLLDSHIEIASLVATIVRLWDDLGSAKDENQDGHDGSYIACYVNEHKGSSTDGAREHVHRMISDAWKCLNETCQSSPQFSAYFKEAVLNSARMVPVMYNYDKSRQLPSLEKHMKSLLISGQTTVIS